MCALETRSKLRSKTDPRAREAARAQPGAGLQALRDGLTNEKHGLPAGGTPTIVVSDTSMHFPSFIFCASGLEEREEEAEKDKEKIKEKIEELEAARSARDGTCPPCASAALTTIAQRSPTSHAQSRNGALLQRLSALDQSKSTDSEANGERKGSRGCRGELGGL
jgi:hypothetical protein